MYVSRFSNRELKSGKYTVYGICKSMPKYPTGYWISGNLRILAPSWSLFRENDRERFESGYWDQLERTGLRKIKMALNSIDDEGKDVVLCCYEDVRDPKQFCHRTVFAKWWEEKTGEAIPELPDPSPNKWLKKEEPEVEGKEEFQQLSLFDML